MDFIDTLSTFMQQHEGGLTWVAALSLFFFVGTLILVPLVIIALPPDYLTRKKGAAPGQPVRPLWKYPYIVAKNLIGFIFILAGVAMLVLPGQGLLTLALGLALINFPGKHRAVRRIMGERHVLKAINRLRLRARKPPLNACLDRAKGEWSPGR